LIIRTIIGGIKIKRPFESVARITSNFRDFG
jgi:hypothetical protein